MRDPCAARSRRPRGLTGLVTGLVVAAVVASGCSVIPAGTGPQPASAPPPPAGAGPCCGLLVRSPQVGWSPASVVKYFLLASAIGAHDYAVARQYLTPAASKAWRPGTAVTILTKEPQVTARPGQPRGPDTKNIVQVTGQEQARLTPTGQYQPSSGAQAPQEEFILQYTNGTYKISQLFSTAAPGKAAELMLTSDLFHLEYTPRNLYYYGGRNDELLPYPVFVPIQGTNPAGTLIYDLISGPRGWLAPAARTVFPAGAHLAQPIQVFPGPSGGRTAIVNIAVPRHSARLDVQKMAAQLVTTLTSPVYSAPLFRAVKLKINGRLWPFGHPATLRLATYQRFIPHWPSSEKAYYLTQDGSLRSLGAQPNHGSVVFRGTGTAQVALSRVAVSPDGRRLAGLGGAANTIYTGGLVTSGQRQSVTQLHAVYMGTKFTSLSWDRLGDLWVAGKTSSGPGVWVLVHGTGSPVQVQLPLGFGRVTALRVAPDGDRVAMIVGTGAGAHLVLAAAMRDRTGFLLSSPDLLGPSMPPPVALAWFDEDHLLVVTGTGQGSQLWEVPVDGDNPSALVRQAGIVTVAAAGPGNPLYLGLAGGRLDRLAGPNQPLADITAGQAVTYPG